MPINSFFNSKGNVVAYSKPIHPFFNSKMPAFDLTMGESVEDIKAQLKENLFCEQVEVYLESEKENELNHMISCLLEDKHDVPHVSSAKYQNIQQKYNEQNQERAKERAAGEYVPHAKNGPKVKLAASDCAIGREKMQIYFLRYKNSLFFEGWDMWILLVTCASRYEGAQILFGGWVRENKLYGKFSTTHAPPNEPILLEQRRKDRERKQKSMLPK
jgi:hypothetical protein